MTQKQKGAFCRHCQKDVLATGTKPNHILHLILTIITFGLWLLIWPLISVGKLGGYRCTQCGNKV